MQLMIFSTLVQITYPPHTLLFFQGCIVVAQMDILDGGAFFDSNFDFVPTEPLNQWFEDFGIDSKQFLINTGSFTPLIMYIIGFNFMLYVLNKIAVKHRASKIWRRIGIWAYNDNYLQEINL